MKLKILTLGKLALKLGYEIFILTGRNSTVTYHRCKELGINNIFQGVYNKVELYEEIKSRYCFKNEEAAYMGDDLNDISLLKKVGFSATVNDAPYYIKEIVDFIVPVNGGKGAVREFVEEIIKRNGQWEKVLNMY